MEEGDNVPLPGGGCKGQGELPVVTGPTLLEERAICSSTGVGTICHQELHHVQVVVHDGNVNGCFTLVQTRGVRYGLALLVGRVDDVFSIQRDEVSGNGQR